MPGIFLGLKFQACVFFWVCNMKLRRTPPSCILRVPPPPPWAVPFVILSAYVSTIKPTGVKIPGGGDSHLKGTGMLVVSLRGVTFRFWSRLGSFWQNVIISGCQGLV